MQRLYLTDNAMQGDSVQASGAGAVSASELWRPVIKELEAFNEDKGNKDNSLIGIFFYGYFRRIYCFAYTMCVANYSNDS